MALRRGAVGAYSMEVGLVRGRWDGWSEGDGRTWMGWRPALHRSLFQAADPLESVTLRHAGKTFVDHLKSAPGSVTINADGRGDFTCQGGSVSVRVPA